MISFVIVRNSEYEFNRFVMITEKIAQLVELKAKVVELEKQAAAAISAELAALPGRYGFPDVKSFLSAMSAASGSRRGRRGRPRGTAQKNVGKGSGRRRRRATATATKEYF